MFCNNKLLKKKKKKKKKKLKRGADYTYQDLIENPMILFTCDQRVYQNPKLLEIFLLVIYIYIYIIISQYKF